MKEVFDLYALVQLIQQRLIAILTEIVSLLFLDLPLRLIEVLLIFRFLIMLFVPLTV